MAKIGLRLKINVSTIEKARLFAGAKGKYLDATVFVDIDELDQYGNSGMITQDVKVEEKQAGVKGAILGNCKVFWKDEGQPQSQQPQYAPPQQQQQQSYAPQPRPAPRPQDNQHQAQQQMYSHQNNEGDGWDDDIPF